MPMVSLEFMEQEAISEPFFDQIYTICKQVGHKVNKKNKNQVKMAPSSIRKKKSPKAKKTPGSKDRRRIAKVLIENEMLIDEVKARAELWVRSHHDYHQYNVTYAIWLEIAQNLDMQVETVKRRWKSLNDHYRRELKRMVTTVDPKKSVWPYYKKMSFLKSQMLLTMSLTEEQLEIFNQEEEVQNPWNFHHPRKQECPDVPDDYDDDYNQMLKFEQHLEHPDIPEIETDALETSGMIEQDPENQDEDNINIDLQEQEVQSSLAPLDDQSEELSSIHQNENGICEFPEIASIQQQPNLSNIATTMASIQQQTDFTLQQHRDSSNQQPTGGMSVLKQRNERISIIPASLRQSNEMNNRVANTIQQQMNMNERFVLRQNDDIPRNISTQQSEVSNRNSLVQQQGTASNMTERIVSMQQCNNLTEGMGSSELTIHDRSEISNLSRRSLEVSLEVSRSDIESESTTLSPHVDDRRYSDDDYHFFMSLVPHVKHFNSLQKLKIRNKIQQIIIEESSNMQYDPLGNC